MPGRAQRPSKHTADQGSSEGCEVDMKLRLLTQRPEIYDRTVGWFVPPPHLDPFHQFPL